MACEFTEEKIKTIADKEGISVERVKAAVEKYNSLDEEGRETLKTTTESISASLINNNSTVRLKHSGKPVELVTVGEETSVYTNEEGNIEEISNDSIYFEFEDGSKYQLNSEEAEILKSNSKFYADGANGFEEWGTDILNNPQKIQELAREIDSVDTTVIPEEHKRHLFSEVKLLTNPLYEALPKLKVLVNRAFEETGGQINMSTGELLVGISPNQGNKSALEVYVHELYHAATHFAVEQKSASLVKARNELDNIMNNFLKNTTAEDLARFMPDTANSLEEANRILDYIAEEGIVEFIPHAKTNYPVIKQLEQLQADNLIDIREGQPLAYKIIVYISNAFKRAFTDYRRKKVGNNDAEKAAHFITQFVHANNKQLEYRRNHAYRPISNFMDRMDAATKGMIEGASKAVRNRIGAQGAYGGRIADPSSSGWKKALYYGSLGLKGLTDQKSKKLLEFNLSMFGAKPEGTISTIIRDAAPNDAFGEGSEQAGLDVVGNLDRLRETTRDSAASIIRNSFGKGRDLKEEELEALRVLTRTDAVVVQDELFRYTDPNNGMNAIEADINEIENKLAETYGNSITNYYREQSKLLAEYLVNQESYITTLKNPHNIAKRVNDPESRVEEISQETIDDIDVLSTLYALKLSRPSSLIALHGLINEPPVEGFEGNGVVTTLYYQNAVRNNSKALFENAGEEHLAIKGYQKDIFPSNSDTMPAPVSQQEEMKRKGYKLVKRLKPHRLHGRQVEMGLYVNAMPIKASLEKAAVVYGDEKHRGYSIVNSYQNEVYNNDVEMSQLASNEAERDVSRMRKEMSREVARMKEGNFTKKKGNVGVNPAVDLSGKVMDFRYEMRTQDKVNLLGMDNNPITRLAATLGDIEYKKESPLHNDKVIDFILDNTEEALTRYSGRQTQFRPGTMEEYFLISPNSTDPKAQEYWSLLPRALREKIKTRVNKSGKGDKNFKGFYVRRDMMYNLLGFREQLLSDTKLVQRMPETWRRNFAVAEAVWKAVVSLAKGNIILRIPTVLVNNTISNYMLSTVLGIGPVKVAKYQLQGVKELQRYLENEKEVKKLDAKIDGGVATQREIRLRDNYKSRMEKSSVRPLIEAGFFTKIVEEMDQRSEVDTGNMISDAYHRTMKKMPKIVRNGTSLLMMDSTTKAYQLMNNATQYSDFVARYAMYQHYKEKGELDHPQIIGKVRDAFVNYYKPSSTKVDLANKLGAVMFTRYYSRIQRFITGSFMDHPFRVFAGLMTLGYLLPGAANPWESSVLQGGVFTVFKSPVDNAITAGTPGAWHMFEGTSDLL